LPATLVRPFSLFTARWSLSVLRLAILSFAIVRLTFLTLAIRPLRPASRRLLTFALARFRSRRRRTNLPSGRGRWRRRFGFLDGRQT